MKKPIIPIKIAFSWTCRNGGGLFLGIHYSFPMVCYEGWSLWYLSLGFVFFKISLSAWTPEQEEATR